MQATIAQTATQVIVNGNELTKRDIPFVEEIKHLTDFEMMLVGGGDGAPEWGMTGP